MLRVKNLTKRYGDFVALGDLSFSLDGEILGIIGENGAGKTTLLKILAGLLEPTSGEINLFGREFLKNKERMKRRLGYLPEYDSLYENMAVEEYLSFFALLYGVKKDGIKDWMKMFNLPNRQISELSKGMKRKVSIARSLLHDPEMLIYDEPMGGLDPSMSLYISKFMKEIGKPILFSAHNLYFIEYICDRILILRGGGKIYEGSVEKLKGLKRYTLRYIVDGAEKKYETNDVEELNKVVSEIVEAGKLLGIDSTSPRLEDIYFALVTG